jgi:predicted nucleotidyltransferase
VTHDTARRLASYFEADAHGASAVYLFGSVARDEAAGDSDVDVGVLFADPPALTLDAQPYGLEGDLERHLGGRVDLVPLNHAPVDLRARVLRDGLLVFERDRAARIRFEVSTRNEAFDLEPILREYRAPREAAR